MPMMISSFENPPVSIVRQPLEVSLKIEIILDGIMLGTPQKFKNAKSKGYNKAIQREECKVLSDNEINKGKKEDTHKANISYKSINRF